MRRRDFLKASSGVIAAAAIIRSACASDWPSRPVKLLVPYGAGGATDLIARPWADALGKAFKQPFVVENRGGAAGMIGTEAVARAEPDGYTLLLPPSGVMSVLPLLRRTPYDPQKDFLPIARLGDSVVGFVIAPSVGVKTLAETVAYAKKNPGKLAFGSAGIGSIQHLRLEMLKFRAGIDILHVPYRGAADALNGLLAGSVQMMCDISPLPLAKAGRLVLLSINSEERSPDFPDTPTLTELGYPHSDLPSWYALWAPAGTPIDIINRLHAKVTEITATDAMKQTLQRVSAVARTQAREDISRFLVADMKTNADLIKTAKIKLE